MATKPKIPAPQGFYAAVGFFNSSQLIGAASVTVNAGGDLRTPSDSIYVAGFTMCIFAVTIDVPAGATAIASIVIVDPETGVEIIPTTPATFKQFFSIGGAVVASQVMGIAGPPLECWLMKLRLRANVGNVIFTNPRLWFGSGQA
jgi:hypothetical protein